MAYDDLLPQFLCGGKEKGSYQYGRGPLLFPFSPTISGIHKPGAFMIPVSFQISNPGLRRPVAAYERDIVARARRQLSRMPKPSLVGHQPVQPILNEDILRFCGENVLIFSGLERLQSSVKDYDSSNVR